MPREYPPLPRCPGQCRPSGPVPPVRASAARPGQCRPSGPVPPQGAPTYSQLPSGHTRGYSTDAAMGTAARSTQKVPTGYSKGYSQGTHRGNPRAFTGVLTGLLTGYSRGYSRGTDRGSAKHGVEGVRSRAGRRRRRGRRNPVRRGLRRRRCRRRRRRPGAGREGVRRFRGGPVAAVPAVVARPRYVPGVRVERKNDFCVVFTAEGLAVSRDECTVCGALRVFVCVRVRVSECVCVRVSV